jgi:hypothetical protein
MRRHLTYAATLRAGRRPGAAGAGAGLAATYAKRAEGDNAGSGTRPSRWKLSDIRQQDSRLDSRPMGYGTADAVRSDALWTFPESCQRHSPQGRRQIDQYVGRLVQWAVRHARSGRTESLRECQLVRGGSMKQRLTLTSGSSCRKPSRTRLVTILVTI